MYVLPSHLYTLGVSANAAPIPTALPETFSRQRTRCCIVGADSRRRRYCELRARSPACRQYDRRTVAGRLQRHHLARLRLCAARTPPWARTLMTSRRPPLYHDRRFIHHHGIEGADCISCPAVTSCTTAHLRAHWTCGSNQTRPLHGTPQPCNAETLSIRPTTPRIDT